MARAEGPASPDQTGAPDGTRGRLQAEIERLRLENEHLLASLRGLDETHAEYVESYDLAPVPLVTLDRTGTIRHVNHAAAALFGQSRAILLGQSLRRLVADEDRKELARYLAICRSGPEEQTCELRLVLGEAQAFPAQLRTRLSSLARGFLQTAILDLRERDQAVDEMHRLVESERIAREEIVAKDKFIAVLSHELRTPLTPVLAAASLMSVRKNLPPEIATVFEMIRRNVAMETRLIDDLLDVTRIMRGRMLVEFQPTDLHQVALEATEMLRDQAAHKNLAIHVELRAERHRVSADPTRLRQVFLNLLRNAIKFTPGGGDLYLRSWNAGTRLTVEVEDNGVGIAPEKISRVFAAFEQVDDPWSTSRTSGGLGLGLAISKGLIDLHGGSIAVASRGENQGSRFAVQLETLDPPSELEAEQKGAATASAPLEPAGVTGSHSKPCILVVDDHPDSLAAMTDLVMEMGYNVETAESVGSALAVDFGRVDILVSDIGLPDGTGWDLMRELQANGRHLPAIAISGFGRESDVRASKEAGFHLHLTKPIDFAVLSDALRTLSARH